MEWRMLGLEVEADEDLAQPLEVAAVVKGLDSEGNVGYWTISTPSLMNVEIIGMMHWGGATALFPGLDDD